MTGIYSIGGGGYSMMPPMKRQDSTQLAETLFSKLDTSGQGYIQKSDLQSAFDKIASTSGSGSSSTVDELFSKFDGNDDGKVTKQEFSDTVTKLSAQLDEHFASTRMQNAMPGGEMSGMNRSGGMPPPPPPGEGPSLSKDELNSTLSQISTSDSRSNMMSNILNNFDAADTDGDGKVSFKEAIAYDQTNPSSASSAGSALSGTDSTSGTSSSNDLSLQLMQQIMKLAEAYGVAGEAGSAVGSSLSTTA